MYICIYVYMCIYVYISCICKYISDTRTVYKNIALNRPEVHNKPTIRCRWLHPVTPHLVTRHPVVSTGLTDPTATSTVVCRIRYRAQNIQDCINVTQQHKQVARIGCLSMARLCPVAATALARLPVVSPWLKHPAATPHT